MPGLTKSLKVRSCRDSYPVGGAPLPRRRTRARRRNRAAGRERPGARGLPRLGVPHGGRAVPVGGTAADGAGDRVRHRAAGGAPHGSDARAAAHPALRQPLRLLLRGRQPGGAAGAALYPRRRLPAVVPLRQLRDAHQPQAMGRGADRRVPPVAAVRVGARHRPHDPPLAAPQPRSTGYHASPADVRGAGDRVPHPGGARPGHKRWGAARAYPGRSVRPGGADSVGFRGSRRAHRVLEAATRA